MLAPFLMKVERVSINNGAVTYRDWVAIVGGGTAILFALIAIVFVIRAKAPPLFAAVAILVGLGGYQIARGFGAFIKTETQPALAIDMPAPPPPPAPPKVETPEAKLAADVKACATDMHACYRAAQSYDDLKNDAKAAEMYGKGCAMDHRDSCRELALYFLRDGALKDEAKFLATTTKACDLGEASSCANLSLAYGHGEAGLAKDLTKSVALAQRACGGEAQTVDTMEYLVARACDQAGSRLFEGEGMKKDQVAGAKLFEVACTKDKLDCKNLGVVYFLGAAGKKKDAAKAQELWQTACDAGDIHGCTALTEEIKDPERLKVLKARIAELKAKGD